MLKTTGIVLSTYPSALFSVPASTTSSSRHQVLRVARPQKCECRRQHRSYAMVSDGHSRHQHAYIPWPEVSSANHVPTPYQIFACSKGAPYSKKRFYELVKQYHPDKHNVADHDTAEALPYATKLERYRLIVAANDLLSDPIKRSAYDRWGAGWNGQPEVRSSRSDNRPHGWPSNGFNGRAWKYNDPKGPSQNATWEDWERWYQRDAKGKQAPVYFSNTAFVALIVSFAALGGIGQATRMGNYSATFIEQIDQMHSEMSKELMQRRMESGMYGSREERIQGFLVKRDPAGYMGFVGNADEEKYRKLLLSPEVCSSAGIKSGEDSGSRALVVRDLHEPARS